VEAGREVGEPVGHVFGGVAAVEGPRHASLPRHRNPGRSGKIRQGEEEGGREVRSLDWEGEMGNGLRAALRWLLLPLLFFF
jgi:hypothetical protein